MGLGVALFAGCVAADADSAPDPALEPWPCESWLTVNGGLARTLYEWDEHHNVVREQSAGWYRGGVLLEQDNELHTWTFDATGTVALDELQTSPGYVHHTQRTQRNGQITSVLDSHRWDDAAPQTIQETWTYDTAGRLATREVVALEAGQRRITIATYPDANTRVETVDLGSVEGVMTVTWVGEPWTIKTIDFSTSVVSDERIERELDSEGRVLVEESRMTEGLVYRTETTRGANGAPQEIRFRSDEYANHTTTYDNECAVD